MIAGFTGILTLQPVVLLSIVGAMPKFEQHLSRRVFYRVGRAGRLQVDVFALHPVLGLFVRTAGSLLVLLGLCLL